MVIANQKHLWYNIFINRKIVCYRSYEYDNGTLYSCYIRWWRFGGGLADSQQAI